MSADETAGRLASVLRGFGSEYVFDTTFSRQLSLLAAQQEFVARFAANNNIPLLTSACPGWICYAEKTHGEFLLPYISTVKSPQQVMGSLVKQHFAKNLSVSPSQIFHMCVMPCFDKKLEASRPDFMLASRLSPLLFFRSTLPIPASQLVLFYIFRDALSYSLCIFPFFPFPSVGFLQEDVREVDCVISTGEVEVMLDERGVDLRAADIGPLDCVAGGHTPLLNNEGTGSGGYLHSVFRYAARTLFGVEVGQIVFDSKKSADFSETSLEVDGRPVLRFAIANGFKNIQTIVRKIKSNKCNYHYIEIMACPKGCNNGGGQLQSTEQSASATFETVNAIYQAIPTPAASVDERVQSLLASISETEPSTGAIDTTNTADKGLTALLHTVYHPVPKDIAPHFETW
eukprot:m.356789 g.356789  ORF g.356789 m.356789 type:complete len:401 (-) comp55958_c1_seq19:293-1495(-)